MCARVSLCAFFEWRRSILSCVGSFIVCADVATPVLSVCKQPLTSILSQPTQPNPPSRLQVRATLTLYPNHLQRLLPTTVFGDAVLGPIVIKCGAALLMLPLQFLRRINSLRFTAYLAFASIIYVSVLVIWHGVLRFPPALKAGSQVKWFNPSAPW